VPPSVDPKIFLFNEEEVSPDVRAQRTLNKARVPGYRTLHSRQCNDIRFFSSYSLDRRRSDVEPVTVGMAAEDIGRLHISMTARFLINDGQHRRAAIEEALKDNPALGDETIAIVFFRIWVRPFAQQMFADLNRMQFARHTRSVFSMINGTIKHN